MRVYQFRLVENVEVHFGIVDDLRAGARGPFGIDLPRGHVAEVLCEHPEHFRNVVLILRLVGLPCGQALQDSAYTNSATNA